jgi:hypothetical protein
LGGDEKIAGGEGGFEAAFRHQKTNMSWSKSKKDTERYYLFAGMGGSAARRKRNRTLIWSLVAAAVVSALLGVAFYYFDRLRRG